MKKIVMMTFILFTVTFSQTIRQRQDGLTIITNNTYTKGAYTSSTANETTYFSPTYSANRIAVFVDASDTIKGSLKYQFKNSSLGYTTDWTAVSDSLSVIGSSSAKVSDRVHAFVPSDTSTSGYDQIRFYVDYTTWLGVAYTGGTVNITTYFYKP